MLERKATVTKFALYVPLQAKPGKENEVADFLRSAVPLVNAESGTISWFARFVGTFDDESGRDAHLNGKVAAALMEKAKAGDLFVGTPETHKTWNSRRQAAQIDPSRSRHDESTTVEDPFC
jgi:quinol monooxygenase YgiN